MAPPAAGGATAVWVTAVAGVVVTGVWVTVGVAVAVGDEITVGVTVGRGPGRGPWRRQRSISGRTWAGT